MAGFGNNITNQVKNGFSEISTKLSTFGMDYEVDMIKNSRAVGLRELQAQQEESLSGGFGGIGSATNDYDLFNIASKANFRKNQASKDRNYQKLREKFHRFSEIDLIDDILDKLTGECIVYNDKNFFASMSPIEIDLKDEVKDKLNYNFKYIYNLFGFNDGITAWNLFKKWLIDGYLAYEIIYNDAETKIIGFKEIQVETLTYGGYDQKLKSRYWYQYKDGGAHMQRKIPDSNIIYISYSSLNINSYVSYIQRLIKAYNVFDTMEQTRLVYAVTQSVFNKNFVIPTGGKSKTRARQSLAKLISEYKEQVFYDDKTGELEINGQQNLPFYKEYWWPQTSKGESPQVSSLNRDGPELQSIEPIRYFLQRLYNASKIPASRFDDQSPARYAMGDPSDIEREEIQFGVFIKRIQSIFQEILIKPVWIQMCLDYPALINDQNFKSALGINYNQNLLFEELKHQEIMRKRVDFIDAMKRLEGDGPNREAYFNTQFLVEEFMEDMSKDMIEKNQKYKEKQKEKNKEEEADGGGLGF